MLFLGGWGQVVVRLQNLYEVVLCDFTKDMVVETKIRDSAPYQHQANGEDSELPVELPSADNHSFFKQLKRLQTTLSTKESLFNVPKGLEARRRISFFSNSLFMTMPRAPSVLNISNSELCKLLQILLLFLQFLYKALYSQLFFNWVYMIFKVIDGPCCGITWQVDKMLAFSVLTPYYKEDVIYSMKALSQLNEDGVSILYYLKTIFAGLFSLGYFFFWSLFTNLGWVCFSFSHFHYNKILSGGLPADDWRNFKQRFPNPDLKPDQSEDDTKFIARMEALDDAIEIRMWASYRGQTLARTVRGMMYYERSVPLSFEEVISREGFIGQCVRWYAVKFWSWVYHSAHAQPHDHHLLHCFILSRICGFWFSFISLLGTLWVTEQ